MSNLRVFATSEVSGAILAKPSGHKHLRLALLAEDNEVLIFPEAVVAAIVRAYVNLKTHPQTDSVFLTAARLAETKDGYAETQLIEREHDLDTLENQLAHWLGEAQGSAQR